MCISHVLYLFGAKLLHDVGMTNCGKKSVKIFLLDTFSIYMCQNDIYNVFR